MNYESWIRRRWVNFRYGHAIYLIFVLTFANFVLIFHRLLIERVEFLSEIFSSLWIFVFVFIVIYVPVAIIVGHWHRKTQVKIENELFLRQNPMLAKWFRILIEMQSGQASKEEVENLRNLLKAIEMGKDKLNDE